MADARAIDPKASAEIEWLIELVSAIRSVRAELNVPPGAYLQMSVSGAGEDVLQRLSDHATLLQRMGRVKEIVPLVTPQPMIGASAQIVVGDATYILPLEGVIDLVAERARLAKAAEAAEKERDALAKRLGNPGFVEKAAPQAVEKARADHADRAADAGRLRAALARLG